MSPKARVLEGPQMMVLLRAIGHSCNGSLGSRAWLEEAALGETLLFLCFLATTSKQPSSTTLFHHDVLPQCTQAQKQENQGPVD